MSGCVTEPIRYNFGMLTPPPPKLDPVYVLGFAFLGNRVLLIRKTKPAWQAGKLNGVGGKVEPFDADLEAAMIREFREETGITTQVGQWHEFGRHIRPSKFEGDQNAYRLVLFACYLGNTQAAFMVQTTEEEPMWLELDQLGSLLSPGLLCTGVSGVVAYIGMAMNHLDCLSFYTTTIES